MTGPGVRRFIRDWYAARHAKILAQRGGIRIIETEAGEPDPDKVQV